MYSRNEHRRASVRLLFQKEEATRDWQSGTTQADCHCSGRGRVSPVKRFSPCMQRHDEAISTKMENEKKGADLAFRRSIELVKRTNQISHQRRTCKANVDFRALSSEHVHKTKKIEEEKTFFDSFKTPLNQNRVDLSYVSLCGTS
jgi:hypothetical protein